MADPNARASHQPLTIRFIENRLPALHPAFADPPVHWDNISNQFIPNNQALVPMPNNDSPAASSPYQSLTLNPPPSLDPLATLGLLPPRPAWTDTKAMQFWNTIFHAALVKFKSNPATPEPKGRSKTPYSIRDKRDWDDIYDTLELARNEYRKVGGRVGWLRKIRRKAADNVVPLAAAVQSASDIAPQNPYSTPVLGAVGVLLDAVKQAASVRSQVLEGFENLIPIFSDVELFLGTFPGDINIKDTCIDLTITTLFAIEQAIGFFIRNELIKGGKAILMRSEYEKGLLDSLGEINTKSTKLMSEAIKSHLHEVHLYSQTTQKMINQMVKNQQEMANGLNSIERLLSEHMERKERELEVIRQKNMYLTIENARLRSVSPILSSPWAPPPQPQTPVIEWYINQETLRKVLDTPDLDYVDISFILDKKEQLPPKQRAQAEQIINTSLFRSWIVSTPSTKLLVQWASRLPQTIAEVSPLSVFCATMTQALHAKERFISIQWFCGQHIDPTGAGRYIGGRAMLANLISQLLREHIFDTRLLHHEINLSSLQDGQIEGLERLMGWLVRQLPQTITLFCIIDGVVLYEREEHYEEALPALAFLLSLTTDPRVSATIKVLFTSTPGPDTVRAPFEAENLILNVDTLARLESTPSDERLARELGDGLGERVWEYQQ